MGFVPFNNTIKLETIYSWDGQYVENVFFYIVDETPDVATATSLCNAWAAVWDSKIRFTQPSNVILTALRGTIMEEENSPGVEVTSGLPTNGSHVSPSLPNNVSLALRWTTALRGRSYRGRTYHVGMPEAEVTGNAIVPAYLTALLDAYNDIITLTVDVGPALLGVASRRSHGVERTQGVITPVTGLVIDQYVDSQRRRLPGRGR